MSSFARLTQDLAAIQEYPLGDGDLRRLDPLRAWPAEPTDANLAGTRFVRVRETARPDPGYGGRVQETAPTKGPDGFWYQTWQVVPADLAALKLAANREVNEIENQKISTRELARGLAQSPPAPRPRTVQVMAKADEVRGRIDAATTANEIKAILDELGSF